MPETERAVSPMIAKKRSAFVKWALVLGIAILLNLFLTYVVKVLYTEPQYTDFCPEKQVNVAIETQEACLKVGGQWNENVEAKRMTDPGMPSPVLTGYCNTDFTCSGDYNEAYKMYNRNVFIVFVVAGMLLLAGSVFLTAAEAVSLALSFGGVLALIIGSTRYWSDMNDVLRVVILGAALAVLIWVAWKKFRD